MTINSLEGIKLFAIIENCFEKDYLKGGRSKRGLVELYRQSNGYMQGKASLSNGP